MAIWKTILKCIVIKGSMILPSFCFAQLIPIDWQQLENRGIDDQKNVFIFIHTDWCSYCKLMQNTTFRNKEFVEDLNQNFYYIELNAEDDKEIFFAGHTFQFKPRGRKSGTHELAEALGTIDGKISYPTLVILNPQNEIIFQYSGYMKREGLLSIFVQLLNR